MSLTIARPIILLDIVAALLRSISEWKLVNSEQQSIKRLEKIE